MVSYQWRPIADLPDDWEGLARTDLDQMLRLWNEERQHLNVPDRGTTESLVELGLGAIEQFSTTVGLTSGITLPPTTGRWRYAISRAAPTYQYSPDLKRYKQWVTLRLPGPELGSGSWHVVVSFHHKESRSETMAAVTILTSAEPLAEIDIADRLVIPTASREFTYSGGPPQDDRFRAGLDSALTTALEEWQARI
jgi:hypothetical protein